MDEKIKDSATTAQSEKNRIQGGLISDVGFLEDEVDDIYLHHSSHSHSGHHSHHSSQGHHSNHSHHSSGKRRKKSHRRTKEKIKRFVRYNKKNILVVGLTLTALLSMIVISSYFDSRITNVNQDTGDDNGPVVENYNKQIIDIELPFFTDDVVIVSPAVEEFLSEDNKATVKEIFDKYDGRNRRLDIGKAVELYFDIKELPDGYKLKNAEFIIADNESLKNPFIFRTESFDRKIEIYNLKTGTKYFYRINLTFTNSVEWSVDSSFRTAAGPRVLNVDGAYNLRDIGGWQTADGKFVKQGMLYRGCEIDGAVKQKYTVSDEGINTMLTVLGIKTDMDLRLKSDNEYGTNILGASVKHKYYETEAYSEIFADSKREENIRNVFKDLADKDNYPVYLHCTYGQDRTGTICFMLGALLGVKQGDLMKDYCLSGLHHGDVYGGEEPMKEFVSELKKMPGRTLSDKVQKYLVSIGVTTEEIKSIKSIFLDN